MPILTKVPGVMASTGHSRKFPFLRSSTPGSGPAREPQLPNLVPRKGQTSPKYAHYPASGHGMAKLTLSRIMNRNKSQPNSPGDHRHHDSSVKVKVEPDHSSNNFGFAEQHRSPISSDQRPAKRPAPDQSSWPNKLRSGSNSPYSSARPDGDYSHYRSPGPDSSGFHSAQQTPVSSPRAISRQPALLSHHNSRGPRPEFEADRKIIVPRPPDPDTEDDIPYEDTKMLLQPETRPISQEQLVNEVKGIYAGLVMVEKKCVEICQQQAQTTNKLSNEQWQALIALHRTLLHEHHDFFLA